MFPCVDQGNLGSHDCGSILLPSCTKMAHRKELEVHASLLPWKGLERALLLLCVEWLYRLQLNLQYPTLFEKL